MVVKLMRWRARPPPKSKEYEVKLLVRSLRGFDPVQEGAADQRLMVEVRWKGPKVALIMSSLRRVPVKRNFTKEADLAGDGVVSWDEEFDSFCTLPTTPFTKDNVWEIGFTVFSARAQQLKSKVQIVGTASVNLAEYVSSSSSSSSSAEQKDIELNIPLLSHACGSDPPPSLSIKLSLVEVRRSESASDVIAPSATSPSRSGEKSELSSALKASLQKVKNITEFVSTSTRKSKKTCHETEGTDGQGCSGSSEDGSEYTFYPMDSLTESLCDSTGEDRDEEEGEDCVSGGVGINKSFNYGSIAYANFAGGLRVEEGQNEDWVYYSSHGRRSDVGSTPAFEDLAAADEEMQLYNKRSILLPWRKRKLNYRSPKTKGEPLLKKAYADEGGDDIDFDRRQLSSDESQSFGHKNDEDSSANQSSFSEFGDDNFAVGSWENKDITSRDGHMKLQTQVFFASIDQRSERAAGESACTALVAVIADWFHTNPPNLMPIKSQFDTLIRDGSSEWRNLCANEEYRQRFPDKHFDLETVLESKIRAVSVVPDKSLIGFFHPEGEGVSEEGNFDFLQGSLSFDAIWDEISRESGDSNRIYIVSWNDHFFVLRVEGEAYYLIDTLGERLYEGCNEAYVLKFDCNTSIFRLESNSDGEGETVLCRGGSECCKEYIKRFLAAIPVRELQSDLQKGLGASTSLHHRLQIEFHYTQPLLFESS